MKKEKKIAKPKTEDDEEDPDFPQNYPPAEIYKVVEETGGF